ncbi:MAG: sigma-54-dependent Fis family transcriptional regulator, partial [Phycisphaerae bacterium]|nr:sigma-54-dependent Fis family transcriptional regulator [Phycisphaerae bacterium]
ITKPFNREELLLTVSKGLQYTALVRENRSLKQFIESRFSLDNMIGSSPAMRDLRGQVEAVAASQGTVLVCGESGVGKEVVARAVHENSTRATGPFLAVNCAALSESLLESELFGHERGAFTGAEKTRKGRFELADGGTLLLDEVSEVPPPIQAKLLRVLQERAFERVGSSITIGVDVRLVATSNRDLGRSIDDGEFRQDLFFRLNVLPIHVPPLRERREDIPELVASFMDEIRRREGRGAARIEPGAMALLREYHWPGNVRELQNICERAIVLSAVDRHGSRESVIGRGLIEPWLGRSVEVRPLGGGEPPRAVAAVNGTHGGPSPLSPPFQASPATPTTPATPTAQTPRTLEEIERDAIVQTLVRHKGHRQRTAVALGIGVRTLGLKLKRWKQLQLVEPGL